MAVITHLNGEQVSGPKYEEWTYRKSQSLEGKVTYIGSTVYYIVCDAIDSQEYAISCTGQDIGSVIGRMRCNDVNVDQKEWKYLGNPALRFRVELFYSSEAPEKPNPLDISQHHIARPFAVTQVSLVDGEGNALKNVNGEPLEGESKEVIGWEHTITRNVPANRLATIKPIMGKLNGAIFSGYAPKTLRLVDYQYTDPVEFEYGSATVTYVTETIVIQEAPDGQTWEAKPLNRGFMAKEDAEDQDAKPILDANRERVTSPRLLAADGTVLPTDGTPYFIPDVYMYEATSFSPLDITLP